MRSLDKTLIYSLLIFGANSSLLSVYQPTLISFFYEIFFNICLGLFIGGLIMSTSYLVDNNRELDKRINKRRKEVKINDITRNISK